jgi:E3 ubiquitin-protein ligase listerin
MASHDIDRQVATYAHKSWIDAIGEGDKKFVLDEASLLSFVQRALLDPGGVYSYLNPIPPAVAPPPLKKVTGRPLPVPAKRDDSDTVTRTKGDGDDENEQDRKARLRVGAFGALAWLLGKIS